MVEAIGKKLLLGPQAAEVLGVKASTLRKWRHTGFGPPFLRFGRLHGRVYYSPEDLTAWLAEQRRYRSTSEETAG